MSDRLRLTNALLLSMLLHVAALSLIGLVRQVGPSAPVLPALLDVDVLTLPPPAPAVPAPPPAPPAVAPPAPAPPPPVLPKAQIVSPPEAGKEAPPKDTRFLSDRDVTVEQQTVRRGEGGTEAAPEPPKARAEARANRSATTKRESEPPQAGGAVASPPRLAAVPGLDELLPTAGQLAREGYGEPVEDDAPAVENDQTERRDVLRFADAGRAGRRGTLDFIPDVREGDITLLNTKAERFAPFVRRVAQRVFQTQVISLRRDLPRAAVSAQESVTVEAIMNRRGNLVSVQITDRSATNSTALDRHLQRACHQAFFDLNPPAGAEAADGNIHFLFRTQIEVFIAPNGVSYGGLLMAGLL